MGRAAVRAGFAFSPRKALACGNGTAFPYSLVGDFPRNPRDSVATGGSASPGLSFGFSNGFGLGGF